MKVPLDIGLVVHRAVRNDGQGRVMVELARALARRGHAVTVYAQAIEAELTSIVEHVKLPAPSRRIPKLARDVVVMPTATGAVRRRRHDVTCVMGAVAIPRHPYVMYAQFSQAGWRATWTERTRPSAYHRANNRVGMVTERLVARSADHVLACAEHIPHELGVGPADVTIVPNGIDPDEFRVVTSAERAARRQQLGLPADAFAIAFAGEYRTGRKGLLQLLEAVAEGGPDEHVLVAGDGPADAVRDVAAASGIAERVHLLGFVPARAVLEAADACAVTSLYEPFSIVALEAAASGVPLVLSARAGAAAHLGRDASVLVQHPEDPVVIRSALDHIRASPELRRSLVASGTAVAERLTWDHVMAQAVAVLERVAAGRA